MPVAVRNKHYTHVVLSTLDKGPSIEWAPAGDPDGNDIQHVPDSLVEANVNFHKAVAVGLLSVETDDAQIRESVDRQAARFRGTQTAQDDLLASVLDTAAANGVVRITEEQLDRHIDSLSKAQHSDLSTIGENR